jgi:hypothetical protein
MDLARTLVYAIVRELAMALLVARGSIVKVKERDLG